MSRTNPTPTPGFSVGVPPGGSTNNVLKKNSGTDGDVGWGTAVTGLTVPQSHEGATSAPVALTAATVSTANATDLATSEALANSLKTQLNAVIADNVNLQSELATLTTAHNALLTALQTAGILS